MDGSAWTCAGQAHAAADDDDEEHAKPSSIAAHHQHAAADIPPSTIIDAAERRVLASAGRLALLPPPMVLARLKVLLERLRALAPASFPSSPAAAAAHASGQQQQRRRRRAPLDVSAGGAGDAVSAYGLEQVVEEVDATFCHVSPFLRALPRPARRSIARDARLEFFKRDQAIFSAGAPAERLYVVLSGTVRLYAPPYPPTQQQLEPADPAADSGGGSGASSGARLPLATLRRGAAIGAINVLDGGARAAAAAPVTAAATLLSVAREDFVAAAGREIAAARDALVAALAAAPALRAAAAPPPRAALAHAAAQLLEGGCAVGRIWEVASERQIYFIESGTAQIEFADAAGMAAAAAEARAAASAGGSPSAKAGDGQQQPSPPDNKQQQSPPQPSPPPQQQQQDPSQQDSQQQPLAESGVLASIRVAPGGGGRVEGTLGLEAELRRAARLGSGPAAARRAVARLGPGDAFGGGALVAGAGPLQARLRVVATAPLVYRHADAHALLAAGGPELASALRDDVAFRLSYALGRMGLLAKGAVVGHPSARLRPPRPPAPAPAPGAQRRASMTSGDSSAASSGCGSDADEGAGAGDAKTPNAIRDAGSPAATAPAATGGGSGGSRQAAARAGLKTRRPAAALHAFGGGVFSAGVTAALAHVRGLEAAAAAAAATSGSAASDGVSASTAVKTAPSSRPSSAPSYARHYQQRAGVSGTVPSRPPTAADRFWLAPEHCRGERGAAVARLLSEVCPGGLTALVDRCGAGSVSGGGAAGALSPLATARQQQQQQQQQRPASAGAAARRGGAAAPAGYFGWPAPVGVVGSSHGDDGNDGGVGGGDDSSWLLRQSSQADAAASGAPSESPSFLARRSSASGSISSRGAASVAVKDELARLLRPPPPLPPSAPLLPTHRTAVGQRPASARGGSGTNSTSSSTLALTAACVQWAYADDDALRPAVRLALTADELAVNARSTRPRTPAGW